MLCRYTYGLPTLRSKHGRNCSTLFMSHFPPGVRPDGLIRNSSISPKGGCLLPAKTDSGIIGKRATTRRPREEAEDSPRTKQISNFTPINLATNTLPEVQLDQPRTTSAFPLATSAICLTPFFVNHHQ